MAFFFFFQIYSKWEIKCQNLNQVSKYLQSVTVLGDADEQEGSPLAVSFASD